jgi:hypothetical protein
MLENMLEEVSNPVVFASAPLTSGSSGLEVAQLDEEKIEQAKDRRKSKGKGGVYASLMRTGAHWS